MDQSKGPSSPVGSMMGGGIWHCGCYLVLNWKQQKGWRQLSLILSQRAFDISPEWTEKVFFKQAVICMQKTIHVIRSQYTPTTHQWISYELTPSNHLWLLVCGFMPCLNWNQQEHLLPDIIWLCQLPTAITGTHGEHWLQVTETDVSCNNTGMRLNFRVQAAQDTVCKFEQVQPQIRPPPKNHNLQPSFILTASPTFICLMESQTYHSIKMLFYFLLRLFNLTRSRKSREVEMWQQAIRNTCSLLLQKDSHSRNKPNKI